jgi:hypothetical protein
MQNIKLILFILLSFSFLTCLSQKSNANYYSYKNECLEDKLDGDYIIKGWGNGSTKSEAIDQAKRNVLNDLLLNGIYKGCNILPLIVEINAKDKYKDYIYSLFNSDLDDYIKIEKSPKTLKKSKSKTTYGVKFRVKRQLLKQKLITDNILKQ